MKISNHLNILKISALVTTIFLSCNVEAATSSVLKSYLGSCLDDQSHGTASGSAVQGYSCLNDYNQLWTFEIVNNVAASASTLPLTRIVNEYNGLCLDLASQSTANGIQIVQNTCNISAVSQQWLLGSSAIGTTIYNNPGPYYTYVKNNFSGKCLNVASGSNGASVTQTDCTESSNTITSNQAWYFGRVGI